MNENSFSWTHVALLRGINVGGNNIIPMRALAACLTEDGLDQVRTYIQSGNVLFTSGKASTPVLERRIEKAVTATFGCTVAVVVRSAKQMRGIVEDAPRGFGGDAAMRYNVLFCKRPLRTSRALAELNPKKGVDEADAGDGVLYVATVRSQATRSALPRIIGSPVYRLLTIRNWNTTQKLAELLTERVEKPRGRATAK